MVEIGKLLVFLGGLLLLFGAMFLLAGRIPMVGRLPGDFSFHRGNVSFYFPLVTSIVISLVLTILLNVIGRLLR